MKKILLGIGIILILVWFLGSSKKEGGLIGPAFIQQIIHGQPTPTPVAVAAPVAPKTFTFDSSTDLKQELDKVNPQVLDSDFQ